MSKNRIIVPYTVSILLLIASFFVNGPELVLDRVPMRDITVAIEFTLGNFLTLWLISLIAIIVLETIGIWSDKSVNRNPWGPYVVLIVLSSSWMLVLDVFYFLSMKVDLFVFLYALFCLLAPIVITWIYMFSKKSKVLRIVALAVAVVAVLVLLWTIRVIRHGVYGNKFSIADRLHWSSMRLSIIPMLFCLLAIGINLFVALSKKNSFKFKWCALAITIVITLFVPMFMMHKAYGPDILMSDKLSIVGNIIEEKPYLFGFISSVSRYFERVREWMN